MAPPPHGIDVSSWQGEPSWAQVAASGRTFAWTKATGGTSYRNPSLGYNAEGIVGSGLQRGYYHYAHETTVDPFPGLGPEAEADWFCSQIEPFGFRDGDLLALDIEDPGAYGDLGEWALRWLQRVEQRVGWRPLVYTNAHYITAHGLDRPDLAEYGLWLAAWQATPPATPQPWPVIAFWQFTENGRCPGVVGNVDLDVFNGTADTVLLYGKPAGSTPAPEPVPPDPTPTPTPPPSDPPVYDAAEPSRLQENDWDCSVESCEWMLYAWGRTPDDDWLENQMIAEGVVSPEVGCLDATGDGLADFLNRHYGVDGYLSENDAEVSFDDVAAEAALGVHPLAIGGRGWYHWSGVRGYDAASDTILLANPAPGWQGVYDTMTRGQWAALGSWSMVRLTHPAAEGAVDVPEPGPEPSPEPTPPDWGDWTQTVGSGLLEMMAQDGTQPGQRASEWFPGDVSPADVESCYGVNGTRYVWIASAGRGFRYRPD